MGIGDEFEAMFNRANFPNRPDHPDFWKLSDIVLRQDGRAGDPTEEFDLEEYIAKVIDVKSLMYMLGQRLLVHEQNMGASLGPAGALIVTPMQIDAFLLGVEWGKAKGKK